MKKATPGFRSIYHVVGSLQDICYSSNQENCDLEEEVGDELDIHAPPYSRHGLDLTAGQNAYMSTWIYLSGEVWAPLYWW